MKKNMIALAVAGALVAPVAMADVTISGGLQAELVQIGGDNDNAASTLSQNGLYMNDGMTGGVQNSGNFGFLAFSASEDLGGGMKALAKYAMNVQTQTGIGTREAYVGLSGGFGTVLAGQLNHPYKTSTVGWDPLLATSFQARGNGGVGGSSGLGLGTAGFLYGSEVANTLAYANNFMGGMVKFVGGVILDEANKNLTTDKTNGKHAKALSVNIAPMSGLEVAIAHADLSEFGTGSTTKAKKATKATKVGVKYSAGAITVAAQVDMLDKGFSAQDKKSTNPFVTATFKMDDANSISASVGKTSKDLYAATAKDGTYMAVGFNHAFSKNTSGMVGYRKSTNMGGVDGADESAAGVGLRVKF